MSCPWMETGLRYKVISEEDGKLLGEHLRGMVRIPEY